MTTVAEISAREQQLDEEGHDDDCAAYEDHACSCGIGSGQGIVTRPIRKPRALKTDGGPWPASPDAVVLEGAHAAAYRRWTSAMHALGEAKNAYAKAGIEAQAAHEALAQLSVGAAP